MADFILGLTGGIGSGKTTVANLFAKLGIGLVDADVIAREVVEPGSQALASITAHFGKEILNSDGSLNRGELRQKVFQNEEQRLWLNNLLHPTIRKQMLTCCHEATSTYVIMVVPLLFENNLETLVDRTLVVDVDPLLQISRTASRDNVSNQDVEHIIARQISREERLKRADDIIDNRGDIAELESQVLALHHKYLQLAAKKQPD